MSYNIVLTTAEDIVAVVDAVIAKGSEAAKDFIAEFTGIATDDQVLKALQMACELQLIVFDSSRGCYGSPSFLARKLVSASSDEQKAVFMRLILEQYAPYNTFKTRYGFTKSIELACRQTKTLHMMTSNERDVKNTLISIATYAKALKSEGANLYSFVEDVDAVGIIEAALRSANITENSLRTYWGENLYTFVNTSNVFAPLVEALQKTHSGTMDVRSIVVCAANAFESFLADFAIRKGVSLSGRNGILQKRDALSAHISKKHRGIGHSMLANRQVPTCTPQAPSASAAAKTTARNFFIKRASLCTCIPVLHRVRFYETAGPFCGVHRIFSCPSVSFSEIIIARHLYKMQQIFRLKRHFPCFA